MNKTLFSKQIIDAAVFIDNFQVTSRRDALRIELDDMYLIEIQDIGGLCVIYVEDHGWVHHLDRGSRLFQLPEKSPHH